MLDGQKVKDLDKYYQESYAQLLNSQEANRRQVNICNWLWYTHSFG